MKKLLLALSMVAMATGAANAQTVKNGNMETWISYSSGFPGTPPTQLERPDGWHGLDSLMYAFAPIIGITPKTTVTKTTDKHGGTNAVKLETKEIGGEYGNSPGLLVNAKIGIDLSGEGDFTYDGGTYVSQQIGSMEAWVKYTPQGDDEGAITILAVLEGASSTGGDSVVGYADTVLSSAIGTYTKIGLNLVYDNPAAVPDKVVILFQSSSMENEDGGVEGSAMWVDDVSISFFKTAVNDVNKTAASSIECYPNPATNQVTFRNKANGAATLNVYTATGRVVVAEKMTGEKTIDVSRLSAGTYYYSVSDSQHNIIGKSSFVVTH